MSERPVIRFATAARDALEAWLAQPGRSQRKLSKLLGVHQQSVSFWVRGVNRPDYHNMIALRMIVGIAEDDWITADERSHLALLRSQTQAATLSALAAGGWFTNAPVPSDAPTKADAPHARTRTQETG